MDTANEDAVAMANKSKQQKQQALTTQAQTYVCFCLDCVGCARDSCFARACRKADTAKKLKEEEEQQQNAYKMQTEMFNLVKQLAQREIGSQSPAPSAPASASASASAPASASASASASAAVPDRFCSKCGKARNGRDPFCSGCGAKYAT
jgi:hypothetical protein